MDEPPGGKADAPGTGIPGSSRTGRRVRRNVLTLVAVVVAYYAAPVGKLPSGAGLAASVVGLVVGLALLSGSIVRQVQRLIGRTPGDESVRLEGLVFLLYVVVPLFALGFYAVEQADAAQFADLNTKTDALYFTMSTLATVGFGDVHATGQVARGLVTVQIAFNIVFVAAVGSVVTNQIRQRAAERLGPGNS